MTNASVHYLTKNTLVWWLGWLSLGLVEVAVRYTLNSSPVASMLFLTILIYSLIGIIVGTIFGIIILLIRRVLESLEESQSLIYFSTATCISLIAFLYALVYFLKEGLYLNSPNIIPISIILFPFSMVAFILFSFFRWMDQKRRFWISYLSLLPPLWFMTSLNFNKNKLLLPPFLQISTFPRLLLLLLCALSCFFLLYSVLSMNRGIIKRWKSVPFLRPILITPLILLLLLFLLFKKDDYQSSSSAPKNTIIGEPNILLIILDAVRADHLSCYGYKRPTTPNLDTFSREGILFKNAYSTDSWTIPSLSSLFTGMYHSKHGAHYDSEIAVKSFNDNQKGRKIDLDKVFISNHAFLSEGNQTLAETLSAKGHRTAGIIGAFMCSSIWGLAQGFDYYNQTFVNIEHDIKLYLVYQVVSLFYPLLDISAQHGYYSKRLASHLNSVTFEWLEKNYDQPFFLFIHYIDAHNPYLPPPPYDEYFGERDKSIILKHNPPGDSCYISAEANLAYSVIDGNHRLTSEETELLISRYDGEIRYIDHCLGLLFEKLKALNVYDNTLIIVTSDHGEAFGEHGLMHHEKALYEELIHVPLIVKYPSTSHRRGVVEKRVSLVDILPTVLSFLNYPIPTEIDGEAIEYSDHPIIGESFIGWWVVQQTSKRFLRDLKAIYHGKYKYIWASNGLCELYDLQRDPVEQDNLVTEFPHMADSMRSALAQCLPSFIFPKKEGEKGKIDISTIEELRALGYVK